MRTYLTDFQLYDDHATHHLTVRDLLGHLSGLPGHNLLWLSTDFSENKVYRRLRHLPPAADLRQKYQYSNLMYLVAGRLIERVSGQSWPMHMRSQILDPIGMKAVYFMPDEAVKTEDVSLYRGVYQINHNGGVLNFVTQLTLFPNQQVSTVVWNNTGSLFSTLP